MFNIKHFNTCFSQSFALIMTCAFTILFMISCITILVSLPRSSDPCRCTCYRSFIVIGGQVITEFCKGEYYARLPVGDARTSFCNECKYFYVTVPMCDLCYGAYFIV